MFWKDAHSMKMFWWDNCIFIILWLVNHCGHADATSFWACHDSLTCLHNLQVSSCSVFRCLCFAYDKSRVFLFFSVSQPLTKALESTSKTFQDIGKLYTEEVTLNHLIYFCSVWSVYLSICIIQIARPIETLKHVSYKNSIKKIIPIEWDTKCVSAAIYKKSETNEKWICWVPKVSNGLKALVTIKTIACSLKFLGIGPRVARSAEKKNRTPLPSPLLSSPHTT